MRKGEHILPALAEARSALDGKRGRSLWRSLDELADDAAFRRHLAETFPSLLDAQGRLPRREALKLMGASLLLGGLAGCGDGPEAVVPYVDQPEREVPGRPRYFASAWPFEGYGVPMLAETHSGRPTKLEGNPEHPAVRGRSDAFTQAAVLGLYDPDRSQAVRYRGDIAAWQRAEAMLSDLASDLDESAGRGFRLLTGPSSSPSLERLIARVQARWPRMRRHVHAPVGEARLHAATRAAFGAPFDLALRLGAADTVVALDADPLGPGPRQVTNGSGWGDRVETALAQGRLQRLFSAEPVPSLTGAKAARRRLPAAAHRIPALAQTLAARLGIAAAPAPALSAAEEDWVRAAAVALEEAGKRALVLVGGHRDRAVQQFGLALNQRLGAFGTTLDLIPRATLHPLGAEHGLEALAADMAAGDVETLAVLGANPVYDAPADLAFTDALSQVRRRIHLGTHGDETATASHWHLPLHHPFEGWGDHHAVDASPLIAQPLMRPLYDTRSPLELFARLMGDLAPSDQRIVRRTWAERWELDGESDAFEARWRQALHDGWAGSAPAPVAPPRQAALPPLPAQGGDGLEIVFRPDPTVWDGSFAANSWLQELPKPLTKLTWRNAAAISPSLAARLGIEQSQIVRLSVGGRSLEAAVWIEPGQAEETVALCLGYGRRRGSEIAHGRGYDAYALRTRSGLWSMRGAEIAPLGRRVDLATTQEHNSMEGHELVRLATMAEALADAPPEEAPPPSLYETRRGEGGRQWAMSIDLEKCIGCSACITACQAENNIPVVGEEQVAMGREMHWLRVDRYYEGPAQAPAIHFQPVPCMHCEKAPCEMGCPVNATVHGPEGLNQMIYNRCIGTRTCSSYCPYKVRRFNFYEYSARETDLAPHRPAQRNPDVTVRSRGVMEKCTYCTQRIAQARIAAKIEDRPIQDGEVQTACQQACPTQAIVFGDKAETDSAVARARRSPRDYGLLEELNTRPRTRYLAKLGDEEGA